MSIIITAISSKTQGGCESSFTVFIFARNEFASFRLCPGGSVRLQPGDAHAGRQRAAAAGGALRGGGGRWVPVAAVVCWCASPKELRLSQRLTFLMVCRGVRGLGWR